MLCVFPPKMLSYVGLLLMSQRLYVSVFVSSICSIVVADNFFFKKRTGAALYIGEIKRKVPFSKVDIRFTEPKFNFSSFPYPMLMLGLSC